MQVVNLEHYIKNKIKDVLVNMKEQYIRQETYDDLNEIQKKTITDKLNNDEYQGKRGLIPYILEDKLDQNKLDAVSYTHLRAHET